MTTALVCGAGGFIGGHLCQELKRRGHWVRGVDVKRHEFAPSAADEFQLLDLRDEENCRQALSLGERTFDEVYQLAADMGGMGFISRAETEVLRNNALINIHMLHTAARMGVPQGVLDRASALLDREDRRLDRMLAELAASRVNVDHQAIADRIKRNRLHNAVVAIRVQRHKTIQPPGGAADRDMFLGNVPAMCRRNGRVVKPHFVVSDDGNIGDAEYAAGVIIMWS